MIICEAHKSPREKNHTAIPGWLSMIMYQKLIYASPDSYPTHYTKMVLHFHVKSPPRGVGFSIIMYYN